MRVLLSIRPQFALQIFEGSKRYEYRRAIFKREGVTSVLVYASAPIGKVIGEFEVLGQSAEFLPVLFGRVQGICDRGQAIGDI